MHGGQSWAAALAGGADVIISEFPIGERLAGVFYEMIALDPTVYSFGDIDEASQAVHLAWRNGFVTRVHWSTDLLTEGLVLGPLQPGDPTQEVSLIDASGRWARLIGEPLLGVSCSYWEDSSELPWAVKLRLGDAGHLVIALGELSDEGPVTMPDCLIVTDSQTAASAYRPPTAQGTAWPDP